MPSAAPPISLMNSRRFMSIRPPQYDLARKTRKKRKKPQWHWPAHRRIGQIRRQRLSRDKVTFINEIADLAERAGADVQEVARGIGLDNRIGGKFLHAGPGFGGSCFPKDTRALVKTAQDHGVPLRIVEAVLAVNDTRKRAMARKVAAALGIPSAWTRPSSSCPMSPIATAPIAAR
jgi:hypothetical protein